MFKLPVGIKKLLGHREDEQSCSSTTKNPGPSGTPTEASSSKRVPPKEVYPMFREPKPFVPIFALIEGVGQRSGDVSMETGSERLPIIPNVVPSALVDPDFISPIPTSVIDITATYNSNIPAEFDGAVFDDSDAECPAEQTPTPEGVVEAYLDDIQGQVHAQIEGNKMPDCYRNETFWIYRRDTWFELSEKKDSPKALYYPRVFVWVPTVLMPKDFEFNCIFCEKPGAKMGESGACLFYLIAKSPHPL